MALGFNQRVCNARDLQTTLNSIVDNLGEGVIMTEEPWIIRLENNDDILICWHEGSSGGGGGGGDGKFVVNFSQNGDNLVSDKTFAQIKEEFENNGIGNIVGFNYGAYTAGVTPFTDDNDELESIEFRFILYEEPHDDSYARYNDACITISEEGLTGEYSADKTLPCRSAAGVVFVDFWFTNSGALTGPNCSYSFEELSGFAKNRGTADMIGLSYGALCTRVSYDNQSEEFVFSFLNDPTAQDILYRDVFAVSENGVTHTRTGYQLQQTN